MSKVPSELQRLTFPSGWKSWSIISGKELSLPREWEKALRSFLKVDEQASFYILEVKDEGNKKSVFLESQVFHSLADKELGLLEGILVSVAVRISLHFNVAGALTGAEKEPPSDRDLKAASRHVLDLLAHGDVTVPGEESQSPKPWCIVQDDSGKFRLERVYFA